MPFRRQNVPLQSRKHEITWSNLSQDASSTIRVILAKGTQTADVTDATATEVQTGATIKWLYFEFHFSAEVITTAIVIHWTINFEPFGTPASTPSTYQQITKRFIVKRGMEMLPKDVGTVFKRIFVVKVPRKYQRLGIADEWTFNYVATSANAINACGICVYKGLND